MEPKQPAQGLVETECDCLAVYPWLERLSSWGGRGYVRVGRGTAQLALMATVIPGGGRAWVCGRHKGGPGKPSCLMPVQKRQAVAATTEMFATAQAVRAWIEQRCGDLQHGRPIRLATAAGELTQDTAAPSHAGSPQGPGSLAKGGLDAHLAAIGLKVEQRIVWYDAMRLKLCTLRSPPGRCGRGQNSAPTPPDPGLNAAFRLPLSRV